MKWIETIKVRFPNGRADQPVEEILHAALMSPPYAGLKEVELCRNAVVATDLCLCLHWERKTLPVRGSTLGLCVAENLKEFGLVHHDVWIQETLAQG